MNRFLLLLLAACVTGWGAPPVNRGLVAFGRIPADTLDVTGQDTLGGVFSAMAVDPVTWNCTNDLCSGILYGLTDRGFGNGTTDYRPRIEVFHCTIDLSAKRVTLTNTAALLLKDTNGACYSGLIDPPPDRQRLDPEGLVRLPDGSFFISEEYGPRVMKFDAEGHWLADVPMPAIYQQRRDNRGLEGLTLLPGQAWLATILQSPLLVDGGADNTSRNTRLLFFHEGQPVAEYVYQLSLNGNPAHTRHTTVSEMLALSSHEFLVLERDNRGVGGESAPFYKRVRIAEVNGATNLLRLPEHDKLPKTDLPQTIQPVQSAEFIDLLDPGMLAKVGLRPEELPEKWEGMALIRRPGTDDALLLVGTDNDFKAHTVIHNGAKVGENALAVDTFILVYRVTLPAK